jgi:hypothetical protein
MKLKISMFVLPHEIDLFEQTVIQLKQNSLLCNGLEVVLDATLCVSPVLTNWGQSQLPRNYFITKFKNCERYTDWCEFIPRVEHGLHAPPEKQILGCVSKRREAIKDSNVDAHMWLDCDMIFPDHALYYIHEAMKGLRDAGQEYYVITPEIVKIWDDSWDNITNENFLGKKHNFHLDCDIITIVRDKQLENNVSLHDIVNFKFAGGWMTVLSNELVKLTPIPEELGHYGLEDMFVMQACGLLRDDSRLQKNVKQFVLRNLIVGENHKYRNDSAITELLNVNDKKSEYRDKAWAGYNKGINDWYAKITLRST